MVSSTTSRPTREPKTPTSALHWHGSIKSSVEPLMLVCIVTVAKLGGAVVKDPVSFSDEIPVQIAI